MICERAAILVLMMVLSMVLSMVSCGGMVNNTICSPIGIDSIMDVYHYDDTVILSDEVTMLIEYTKDTTPVVFELLQSKNDILELYEFYNIFTEELAYRIDFDMNSHEVREQGHPLYINGVFTYDGIGRDTLIFTVFSATPPFFTVTIDLYDGSVLVDKYLKDQIVVGDNQSKTFGFVYNDLLLSDSVQYSLIHTLRYQSFSRIDTAHVVFRRM